MNDGETSPLLIDLDLARRIEGALVSDLVVFADAMARIEPGRAAGRLLLGGGAAAFTGPGLLGARAQGLGLHGPVSDPDLDRVQSFLEERGARAVTELCPLADEHLLGALEARGYRLIGFRNVYACALPASRVRPSPAAAIEVHQVVGRNAAAWSEVLLDGFGYRDLARRARIAQWNAMVGGLSEARLFTAVVDGAAVGASNMLVHHGASGRIASLGGTATLPAYRRRGVQLALLSARLRAAEAEGCEWAVVTADPGSSSGRNARRAGFSLAFTNVRMARPRILRAAKG